MHMSYAELVADARAERTELVEVEHHGDHAVLRLADPDRLNVLSGPLMVQLLDAAGALVRDPAVRAVVLTGSGSSFCAGGDLRMMQQHVERSSRPDDVEGAAMPWRWIRQQFGAMARLLARSDTVFVAALNGPAAGVGLAFALSSDIALAADDAVLVPAFGRLGLVPEVGTSWALTRALGYRRAFALHVTGRHLGAAEALELGLVDELVPAADLPAVALDWCRRITALPPHAVELAKPLLRAAADAPWEQALTMEEFAEPICFTTGGFRDGVARVVADTSSR
ncbi:MULTISPECIES: enoyl-CoA hydratase/isomerase family protein [Pseudonocardia]|uniref:4-chlorobenzoyl coenzyme A dehalogenase-1 n=2 Tax=Pseudonocardia TaxID=1847 RepID=A0A1Y2MVN1_PSEAH|nr:MULTISPECIES: enoyl-CoA hydratase/isomerase family protein [Pseudonocardia]OSY38698.1 4-chlorobenzoyl coenzyme A dehalogenase-1 [Pseudonocardia autotrophica]TDN74900.1 2-(1,2-epoxy-1,2-dihydrophenyl)acetyl-CoA isomerase [Pseudonocardia autotrophica]BBF98839.1 enoyl-CoA hydratase [Pseudonocardia autotrophica]GEC26557.1 enoyl-CoA hydratase [Pseudonocardia saturnea]